MNSKSGSDMGYRKKKTLALKDQEILLKGSCNLSRVVRNSKTYKQIPKGDEV